MAVFPNGPSHGPRQNSGFAREGEKEITLLKQSTYESVLLEMKDQTRGSRLG
jgi:hypothetical protein